MLIYPNAYLENVTKITIEFLRENNLEGIILDIDNTLIDHDKVLLERSKKLV
ncbi:MAG: hypothetical protein K2H53_06790 [Clostridia bacterium]|nr:hypothetical protein [Clostridia bacterium]